MYLDFYGLKEKPFSLTPDPAFLYYSEAHRRAVAFLKYGLQESKGFLQLTGPVGSGKTTLLRAILADFDEKTRTAYIINPCAPFPDLLRSIMKDLEIPNIPQTRVKIELLDFFHDYLLLQMRRKNSVIVIFDEAQNLSVKNLEEIRMLSNFETTKGKLLQIVFVGQPELIGTLDRPDLRQLKQRIQVRYHLVPLKPDDVKAYIDHRLGVAGSDGRITFGADACDAIYDFSGGIPRLINSVCDVALLIGYVGERKSFDAGIVKEAIAELGGSFAAEPAAAGDAGEPMLSEDEIETPSADVDGTDGIEFAREALVGDRLPADAKAGPERPNASAEGSGAILRADDVRADDVEENRKASSVIERQTKAVVAVEPDVSTGESSDPPEGEIPAGIGAGEGLAAQPAAQPMEEKASQSPIEEEIPEPPADGDEETPASETPAHADRTPAGDSHRRAEKGFLHSLLRHSGGRRFHVTDFDIAKILGREKAFRKTFKTFVGKYWGGENGSPANAEDRGGVIARPSNERTDSSDRANGAAVGTGPGVRTGPGVKTARRRGRSRRGRPIKLREYWPPNHTANVKVAVYLKDGNIVLGTTKNLAIKEAGFCFTPLKPRNGSSEQFVAFEQTVALRFLNEADRDWERNRSATIENPTGRQIIAVLPNGEVIEGFTPKKFDPECSRFFVLSTDDEGNPSWALVERASAVGIRMEEFQEGIYAEKPVSLLDVPETFVSSGQKVCRHESTGDIHFSMGDYQAALSEYRRSLKIGGDAQRLESKVSLSHLNLGINYLKSHKYKEARKRFLKVNTGAELREKALEKAEMIERMLRD